MMQKCEQNPSGNMTDWIDTNAITRIAMKTHRIRWAIENYSKVRADEEITGPDFYLMPTLLVGITLKKNSEDTIYVHLCNKSNTEIEIERKIFLFDLNDKKYHEDTDAKIFKIGKGCAVDIINNVTDKSRFWTLPNNTLIIDLSISLRGQITTDVCPFQYTINHQKKLIEDLKIMLENSVKSDVFFQIGNEQIAAHWSILCSRSQYFRRMFDSEMKERNENSVTITDVSLSTLKKLLKFLYTADFVENEEDGFEELLDLYYAADKYEVADMRTLCGSKIMFKATPDNVCQILQLAHRHNDKDLKLQAMDFIQFHSDAVFETDGWKKFQLSEPLAVELLTFCLKKNKFVC